MIITGLLLGAVLGFVLQRGRFCVTGAFRDVFVTRNTKWLTAFLIVIAVQSIGIFAMTSAGLITPKSADLPLLAVVVGGFVFGFAIVMAGGCATGTYYRAGEGLVGSWLALLTYALFSAFMKTGVLEPFNTWMRDQTVPVRNVYSTLGVSPWILVAVLCAAVAAAAWHHLSKPKRVVAALPPQRRGVAHVLLEKSWHPFATALVIGAIAIAAWPLSTATGRNDGLGITTPSSNLTNYLVSGDGKFLDWGVMLVVGILVGSFIAAKASGEFRVRVPSAQIAVRSVVGGALMGVGAALAGGCTIGKSMLTNPRPIR
ncbi:YeeE/YedE family protein [Mobilicoccus massiliensis]|uniref:YeeE/YedE family protein n=1 Tax=Mobilicoccus massiliensis TaxID=1522310 RepID=UPI0009E31B49|nr:YeeE/YedE family protein [Mobilicoccus massiliensis]